MKKMIFVLLTFTMVGHLESAIKPADTIIDKTQIANSINDILDEIVNEIQKLSYQNSIIFLQKIEKICNGLVNQTFERVRKNVDTEDIMTNKKIQDSVNAIIKGDEILIQQKSRIELIVRRYHTKLNNQRTKTVSYKYIENPVSDITDAVADILEEMMSEMKRLKAVEINHFISGIQILVKNLQFKTNLSNVVTKTIKKTIPNGSLDESVQEVVDLLSSKKSPGRNYCDNETDAPKGEQKLINDWLAFQGFNSYGDPLGTMYTGGTPLFNEHTPFTCSHSKYNFLTNKYPDKPWNKPKKEWGKRSPGKSNSGYPLSPYPTM